MKKQLRTTLLAGSLLSSGSAFAVDLVLDAAHMAETAAGWAQQAIDMASQISTLKSQYDQLMTTYQSIQGVRGMANLVNNRAIRSYLPDDMDTTMRLGSEAMSVGTSVAGGRYNSLSDSVGTMRKATQLLNIASTSLDPHSKASVAYQNAQNQNALNRTIWDESYRQAGKRIDNMQTLLDKVNDAPDDKDIQDLQARIQAEQLMLQNEQIKLAALTQQQQAQRDIMSQQARELQMMSTDGEIPRFGASKSE